MCSNIFVQLSKYFVNFNVVSELLRYPQHLTHLRKRQLCIPEKFLVDFSLPANYTDTQSSLASNHPFHGVWFFSCAFMPLHRSFIICVFLKVLHLSCLLKAPLDILTLEIDYFLINFVKKIFGFLY